MKTGVLLINVGTPDSPSVPDVRKYLSEFLNDPYVIDLPWLWRKILVNGLIVPFRAGSSSKLYEELWTEEGSPLLVNAEACAQELSKVLGDDYLVRSAMRYQEPSMQRELRAMKGEVDKVILVPMYPQYAESTTRTSRERADQLIEELEMDIPVRSISHFFDHPGFISAFEQRLIEASYEEFDHILFSFHGLPERQLVKLHKNKHSCDGCACEHKVVEDLDVCYKAQCYGTVRALVKQCGIQEGKYSVGFQSRLDKKWIKPFSDKLIPELAKNGVKKLLVVSPSFVADCLETIIEIGVEYKELFVEHGGEDLVLVESLNAHPLWVNTLADILKSSQ